MNGVSAGSGDEYAGPDKAAKRHPRRGVLPRIAIKPTTARSTFLAIRRRVAVVATRGPRHRQPQARPLTQAKSGIPGFGSPGVVLMKRLRSG